MSASPEFNREGRLRTVKVFLRRSASWSFMVFTVGSLCLFAAPVWTVQTSGVMSTLRGVSAVSDQIAWASGSGATVLKTSDGGATWTKISVTTDRVDFRDVDAIDVKTVYLLSIGNGPASRIYKTTDGGATWQLQFQAQDQKTFLDAM